MKTGIQPTQAVVNEQKGYFNKTIKAAPVRKSCRGCAYRDRTTHSCDYILAHGTRRPCPADHCTVKDTKTSRAKIAAMVAQRWNADCN